MTEGIIQKICNGYKLANTTMFNLSYADYNQLIIQLRDNLIEAIKQYHFDNDKYFDDTIKQSLIGDKQE